MTVIDRSDDGSADPEERAHLPVAFSDGRRGTLPRSALPALDDAAVEFGVARLRGWESFKVGRRRAVRHVTRFGDPTTTADWAGVQEVRAQAAGFRLGGVVRAE